MAKKPAAKKAAPRAASESAEKDALLEQMEGDFAPAFYFEEPGQMIVGKVMDMGTGFSKFGAHPVVTIKSEADGELYSVHCLQTALRSQMLQANPNRGDRIAVKYKGEKESAQGNTYKDFKVGVDAPKRSFADIMKNINADEVEEAKARAGARSTSDEPGDPDDDLPF